MEIAIGKDQVIWVKAQTVKGTPVWPSATDAVRVTGDGKFVQDRNFYEDKEKVLSRGKLGRLPGLYKAGEFAFPCFIKASGSLGVAPTPAAILKSLFGKEVITGSTSSVYSLYAFDDIPIYLTVLVKNNFLTMLVSDLVVGKGSIPIIASDSEAAIVEGSFSGNFLKSLIAGTDVTTALAAINATSIVVADARKYEVGQKIIVGTSGVSAGHLIETVTIGTNILTIASTGLESEQASGVVVKGWTPAITTSGYKMHGRFGKYQEKLSGGSYVDTLITQAVLDIASGWKLLNDEKIDADYGSAFAPADREITLKLSRYVRSDGSKYRYEANNQIAREFKLQAADGPYSAASGKRCEFAGPNLQIDPPSESGDAERKHEILCHIYDTAALGDALTLTFA